MPGIDKFFAEIFSNKIKSNLDKSELKKIERELFQQEGKSIKMAMENCDLFNSLFKKYNANYKSFELNWFNEICEIKNSKDHVIIHLLDKYLINKILRYFGDDEIRDILLQINEKELGIPDILRKSNVSRTSGYRKIEDLIKNGIIIETSKVMSKSKKISKYKCIFKKIDIKLEDDIISVKGYMSKIDFESSSIIKTLEKY